MNKSLDIIHEEHRALAAMLGGMRSLVASIEAGRVQPDFDLFEAMIRYIDEVPERVHHPKEDQFLFARLRQRCSEAVPVIEQLAAEHLQGENRIRELRAALAAYRQQGAGGFSGFKQAVQQFLEQEWHHMNTEESRIFPLATQYLTPADWVEIDAAFLSNDNPWEGPARQYAALFSQIVNMAPAPVGLGS